MLTFTQEQKQILAAAAIQRRNSMEKELQYRNDTGYITDEWCMYSYSMLVHELNNLDSIIESLS